MTGGERGPSEPAGPGSDGPGAPDRPRGAGGGPPAGRAGAAAADDRYQAARQRAPRPCRVPAAVPLLGRRRRVLRGARNSLPPPTRRPCSRCAARRGRSRRPEHAGHPGRNQALEGALGLVKLALYQPGSAEGAEGEATSTEGGQRMTARGTTEPGQARVPQQDPDGRGRAVHSGAFTTARRTRRTPRRSSPRWSSPAARRWCSPKTTAADHQAPHPGTGVPAPYR